MYQRGGVWAPSRRWGSLRPPLRRRANATPPALTATRDMDPGRNGHKSVSMPRPSSRAGSAIAACVFAVALAACGSGAKPDFSMSDVQAAFRDQGIELTVFSSGQLVSSSPPTVEVEVFASAKTADATSAPQQVNGVEVQPVGTRNVLVWVDSHASATFQQHVSAALAALQHH